MAVYTDVAPEALMTFWQDYDLPELRGFSGISEGTENSNFRVESACGPYILTLFEKRTNPEDLPFFMELMLHLSAQGVVCPQPMTSRTGKMIGQLCGRPAVITSFLQGMSLRRWLPVHCYALGAALARLHVASQGFSSGRRDEPAPAVESVALEALDRWALVRLGQVLDGVEAAYRRYAFRAAFALMLDFTQELSAFYLDASKDWLYNDAATSPRRASALAVMQRIARDLAVALAPLLPFSAEDIWDHLPALAGKEESVHLATWPAAPRDSEADTLVRAMEALRRLREGAFAALEPLVQAWGVEKQAAKKEGREAGAGERAFDPSVRIDHPRDAALTVALPTSDHAALGPFAASAAELLGVGSLVFVTGETLRVEAVRAPGPACARCWRRRPDMTPLGVCTRCEAAVRLLDEASPAGR
jgi:hypothetical protein